MWPILALAAAALIVVFYKWAYLAMQRTPSKAQLDEVLAAVGQGDVNAVREKVANLRGPVGQMLAIGAEHIREPRELIEEAMYESVLTSKQKLLGMLPFVAISASSAPLLGLLGTVTGIINTFTRITVFGSGDVKSLSGGISEALITTEWGLIVAIPALLLHAFLTRKARGIIGQMESAAVAFVNELSRSKLEKPASHKAPERKPTPAKV
jgi:biopolymer transport protein ExbB